MKEDNDLIAQFCLVHDHHHHLLLLPYSNFNTAIIFIRFLHCTKVNKQKAAKKLRKMKRGKAKNGKSEQNRNVYVIRIDYLMMKLHN